MEIKCSRQKNIYFVYPFLRSSFWNNFFTSTFIPIRESSPSLQNVHNELCYVCIRFIFDLLAFLNITDKHIGDTNELKNTFLQFNFIATFKTMSFTQF